jgi:hypothetical protein
MLKINAKLSAGKRDSLAGGNKAGGGRFMNL